MNWNLFINSLLVAGGATLLALVAGFAGAVALAATSGCVRRLLFAFTVAVLALPSFLVTNCWIDLLGINGVLHRTFPLNVFSLGGAIGILALLLWPIPALILSGAWRKLDPLHFETDPALRGLKLLQFLLWPSVRAQIVFSVAVVFALALNNFSVPTVLQVKVFTSELWVRFNTNLDAVAALQLSWPLILVPFALLFFLRRSEVPWRRESALEIAPVLRRQLGGAWLTLTGVVAVLALFLSLFVPVAQLTATSRTWTEFPAAVIAGRSALLNSIYYSAAASALAVLLGLACSRIRALGGLWVFFFVPGVLLGIGAVTAFNFPGLELFSRTVGIVVAVLVIRYIALARSVGRTAVISLDAGLLDVGRLDGARGMALFRRIVLPQIAPQLAAGAYLVYVLCLWDAETILLVVPPGGETLALRIFNLLHYGHNAHVNALCMALLAIAIGPLALFAFGNLVASLFRASDTRSINA